MTTATEPTPAIHDPARAQGAPPAATHPVASCTRAADPERPALHADSPAECIAAVPALLGFVPRRSVVACLLQEAPEGPGRAVLGAVAHHDLDRPARGGWTHMAEHLASICLRENAIGVLLLIVDERAGVGRAWASAAWHRNLATVFESALGAEKIVLDEAWVVREIAEGQPWWHAFDPTIRGVQTDPAASLIGTSYAVAGSLVALDDELVREVSVALERAGTEAGRRFRAAVSGESVDTYRRDCLQALLGRIDGIAAGDGIDAEGIACTAVALRDPTVRDAVFALAGGHRAEPAERLWAEMGRGLTGSDRAEASTLLGYSAYTRDDTALAAAALVVALKSDPDHTIARLLDTALSTGMRPCEIRALACSGRVKASELGVDLDLRSDWLSP
jgi:hypothetical protein